MSLIKNLNILRKTNTTVITKDTKEISGRIVSIDKEMNIQLRNVEIYFKKNISKLDNMLVKGSNIRYFKIDKSINLTKLLIKRKKKKNIN